MPNQTFFNLPIEKRDRIISATIKELGFHTYEHVNVSNIVRDSGIPRGSFYQYFNDKNDLYQHFMTYIAQKKSEHWGDLYDKNLQIPFLDRYYQICLRGFTFAKNNPELMKAGQKIMDSDYFKQSDMMKTALINANNLFSTLIMKDQQLDLIKKDVNPSMISSILLDFMNQITLNEYLDNEMNLQHIEEKINQLIKIVKKGIE
jgi:AcrR family transcriptional regulator